MTSMQNKPNPITEKINPIAKRCVTLTGNHEWRDIKETLDYYEGTSKHIIETKIVWKNNNICVRCIFCGLVDDQYGGQYQ